MELTPEINVDAILEKMKERYAGEKITDIDGVKIDFADSWVHLRKSNTEPIIRIYAEASNIICTAEIPDRHASEEWVPFKVPFLYRSGKSIDKDKLAAGLYNLAIVASSSMDGDRFAGAVGSTLMIDELLLTCSMED